MYLFTQVDDDLGEQLGGQHQGADLHPLVRAVEVGLKPGQGAAEGHAAGDVVDVGSAANGLAFALQAGVLLVPLQQGADEGAVRGDVVGLFLDALKFEAPGLERRLGHAAAVLLGGAQRGTAVKAALQPGLGNFQQGKGHRQLPGHRLRLGDAQGPALPVAVGEQGVQIVQRVLAAALRQRQGAQQGDQPRDGVVALPGTGGVGAHMKNTFTIRVKSF